MHGMAQAVGELTEQGSPAFEGAPPILSQLLKAETADRQLIPKALLADSHGDSRIAAGLIEVGAGGFAPCLQRSDYERTIRRRRCVGSPAGRGMSTRADGFYRWLGFETGWTEGRLRRSGAWIPSRFTTEFTASTPRVRRRFSTPGRKPGIRAYPARRWPRSPKSSKLARSA